MSTAMQEIIGLGVAVVGLLGIGWLVTLFGDCARDSSEFPDQHENMNGVSIQPGETWPPGDRVIHLSDIPEWKGKQ